MKRIILIGFFCIVTFSFGQSDEDYSNAMADFKMFYNEHQYDSIYAMFAESMKGFITSDVLKQQMNSFHQIAGSIETVATMDSTNDVKLFLVEHKKNTWQYRMVLDSDGMITGLKPEPYSSPEVKVIERNTTPMSLPFNEAWFVFWGGTEVEKNYHVAYTNQKYAYDILMVKDGTTLNGDPKKNESYYVFGKEIVAPCDGKVVQVITGVHDNIPGELNPGQLTGNTVVLETANKEYILFAHLKQGSVAVKEGEEVKKGDLLGQCGNSGNTTEPHLHLSLQNQIDMFSATGGKIYFDKIVVNGEVKEDYLPEKGDVIQNVKN